MAINDLDAISICRIIRESAKCGVTRLKLGDLLIDFKPGSESKLELTKNSEINITPAGQPEPNNADPIEQPRVQLTPEQEKAFQDFQEAQMMIEDPIGYEEYILDQDLEAERARVNAEAQHIGTESSLHRS